MNKTDEQLEEEVPNWIRLILKVSNERKTSNNRH